MTTIITNNSDTNITDLAKSFTIEENVNIRNFLEGEDSYIPSGEFLYLHNHPLVRPNFLTQIDDLVVQVGEKLISKKVTGKPIDDLTTLAIKLGKLMDNILAVNTPETLDIELTVKVLREVYQLCIQLNKVL